MSSTPPIVVAREDHARLLEIINTSDSTDILDQLEVELERAHVSPLAEIPEDVVVMNSEVEYEDVESSRRRTLQLVFPHRADSNANRVSILAPLGCALLGLRVGQEIDWRMPGGLRRIRVLSVKRCAEA